MVVARRRHLPDICQDLPDRPRGVGRRGRLRERRVGRRGRAGFRGWSGRDGSGSRRTKNKIRKIMRDVSVLVTNVQSSGKTLLPGFMNGWLKYCAVVHFWQRNILRVILRTWQEYFYTTL